jgi:antitoxin PrlF
LRNTVTINTEGQVTVPAEIMDRLGVKAGDRLEFVFEAGAVIVLPFRGEGNPFAAYAGALEAFPEGVTEINAWVRELRDDDEPRENPDLNRVSRVLLDF